jgi:hypothetical protein
LLFLFQFVHQFHFQFQLFEVLFQLLFNSSKGLSSNLSKKSFIFSSQLYSSSSQKIILSSSCKSTIKSKGEFSIFQSAYNHILDIS